MNNVLVEKKIKNEETTEICNNELFSINRKAILKVIYQSTSYELWVIILTSCIYCTSYELIFACQLPATLYCTSYELPFICDLRVSINCTKYGLLFNWVPKKINMIELLRWCYDKNYYLESLFDKDLGVR